MVKYSIRVRNMKQRLKTNRRSTVLVRLITPALVAVLVFGAIGAAAPRALAESLSELRQRSAALQAQIAENNRRAAELHEHAAVLAAAVAELDAQIAQTNLQIELYSTRIAELELQLKKAQEDLERQKEILRANMRVLYKRAGASTVELLVASDSFSEFIDEQEYLERLKAAIQDSTEKVIELERQIREQRDQQKELLAQQEAAKRSLDETRASRASLLAKTRGEEAEYRKLVENLKKEQAKAQAEIARAIGSGSYKTAPVGPVAAGDIVGGVGSSGLSSGPHLHLEVRKNGVDTNPGPYIEQQPVPRPPAWISQGYGNPDSIYIKGYHPGIDYAGPAGTPISAIRPGYMYRGCSNQLLGTSNNAYGYVAIVEHEDGTISVYAHMTGGPSSCNYNTYY
jgi:septal ring factor EnvC (AmiA/AmiB activator)